MPEAAEPPSPAPQSCGALFGAFQRLALQGFGGVLPVAHRELVERLHWLSEAEFVELLALGQVLPGPNIVNVAVIFGDRHFGWRGSLAACAGLVTMPLLLVLTLLTLYRQFAHDPVVAGALRGMGAVAAGLVLSTAVKLGKTLRGHVLGWPACALFAAGTLVAVGVLRWPLAWVVLALGAAATALTWRRLAAREPAE